MADSTPAPQAPPFELFSWDVWRDPYPYFATLRQNFPIYKHPVTPFWIFSRFEDVTTILTSPEIYSSRFPGNFDRTLNGSDAPEHTAIRRRLNPLAARNAVAGLRDGIEAHAHKIIDDAAGAGRFDFVSAFAQPLPFKVMAEWLGLDQSLYETCVGDVFPFLMTEPMLDGQGEPLVDQVELEQKYMALLYADIDAFAKTGRTGLLPGLFEDQDRPDPLDRETVAQLAKILLFAGHKTSACALANSVWLLLKNPHILDALLQDAGLLASFIEESVRLESPVQSLFRITTGPAELSGTTFPQFSFIRVLVGAANRDEERFSNADEIRLDRSESSHLGYGLGQHLCLGAHLARNIMTTALGVVIDRMDEIECEIPLDEVDRIRSPNFRGIKALPIRFKVK